MFTSKFISNPRDNALRLRITNNRKKREISLGVQLSQEELENALSDKPKPRNLKWKTILSHFQAQIDDIKCDLMKSHRADADVDYITGLVRTALFGEATDSSKKDNHGTFVDFFLRHADGYDRRSTKESNLYTLSVMQKFDGELKDRDFEDINFAWLSGFEKYMIRSGLSQNTRKIHFGNIRAAMRDAYKRELTDADPFRRFSFRPAKTRKRSLSVDELRSLFNYPVEPFAELYRDMFKLIFMLCGINTVDLFRLERITPDGRIEYVRAKTGGKFSIKVEPEAMRIIQKYKGNKGLLCIADRWSDHRNFRHQLNSALKRIGKAQGKGRKDKPHDGLWPDITSYWARHSWATIARRIGISKDDIALGLGHAESVTDIYIDENLEALDAANRKILDYVLYDKL